MIRKIYPILVALILNSASNIAAEDLFIAQPISSTYGSYYGFTPNGIDNDGKLYGSIVDSATGQTKPAIKSGGVLNAVAVPSNYSSSGFSYVSPNGTAIAQVWQNSSQQKVAVYENGTLYIRNIPNGMMSLVGRAVTSGGRVAGTAYQSPGAPFLYFDGWSISQPTGIIHGLNDLAEVVGAAYHNGRNVGALFQNGGFSSFDTSIPSGQGGSTILAINKRRDLVAAREIGSGVLKVYSRISGPFQYVGEVSGYAASAPRFRVNECGTVTGELGISARNGFVWKSSLGTRNLNTVTRNLTGTISSVAGINDRGQMIGRLTNGGSVLLTPINAIQWGCIPKTPVAID